MPTTLSRLALCALIPLLATACASGQPTTRDQPADGDPSAAPPSAAVRAPSFEVSDIDGKPFALADHLGRDVVLMSFWATFCEPCKTEMPFIQKLHDDYGGRGLQVLSVSLDGPETWAEVAPYIKSNDYTFPVVIDEDSSISLAYNPRSSAPFTVLIDRTGRVARTIEGFQLSEAARLEAEVKALLAQAR